MLIILHTYRITKAHNEPGDWTSHRDRTTTQNIRIQISGAKIYQINFIVVVLINEYRKGYKGVNRFIDANAHDGVKFSSLYDYKAKRSKRMNIHKFRISLADVCKYTKYSLRDQSLVQISLWWEVRLFHTFMPYNNDAADLVCV